MNKAKNYPARISRFRVKKFKIFCVPYFVEFHRKKCSISGKKVLHSQKKTCLVHKKKDLNSPKKVKVYADNKINMFEF